MSPRKPTVRGSRGTELGLARLTCQRSAHNNLRGLAALRPRRGSLHYKRTSSLAEVAELLGDSRRVAADHYVYALTDYREVDRRTRERESAD